MNIQVLQLANSNQPSGSSPLTPRALSQALTSQGALPVALSQQQSVQLTLPSGASWQLPRALPFKPDNYTAFSVTRQAVGGDPELLLSGVQSEKVTARLSEVQQAALTSQLMKLVAVSPNNALSSRALVKSGVGEQITLALNNGSLNLPVKGTALGEGQQALLQLTLLSKGGQLTGELTLIDGRGQQSQPIKLTAAQTQQVFMHQLKQAGIILSADSPERLQPVLLLLTKTPVATAASAQLMHLKLQGNQLTADIAGQRPLALLKGGGEASTSPDIPPTPKQRLPQVAGLPKLLLEKPATITSSVGPNRGEAAQVADPKQLHQQIMMLSRQLLQQTGSTTQALAQLVTQLSSPEKSAIVNQSSRLLQASETIQNFEKNLLQPSRKSADIPQTSPQDDTRLSAQLRVGSPKAEATGNAGDSTGSSVLKQGVAALTSRFKTLAGMSVTPDSSQASQVLQPVDKPQSGATSPFSTPGSEQIRTLLSATMLPLSVNSLIRPVAGNDLVGALITLLQFSLAGRAISRQPALAKNADSPDSLLSSGGSGKSTNAPSVSRSALELSQADSRNTLLNALKTLLANHQQSRLNQADSRLQGQDSFFYQLPLSATGERPCELVIQREPQERRQADKTTASSRCWNLTMRLDAGPDGSLLAKTKIQQDVLEIDIYAESEHLLTRVYDTLPFLLRHLETRGLSVARSSIQRGQVPETLNSPRHHIFETMV